MGRSHASATIASLSGAPDRFPMNKNGAVLV